MHDVGGEKQKVRLKLMMLYSPLLSLIAVFSSVSSGVDGFSFKRINQVRSGKPPSGRPLVLHMTRSDLDNHGASSPDISRRDVLVKSSVSASLLVAACGSIPQSVYASQSDDVVHMSASWSAVDGLNSLNEGKKFVSFDQSAYKAMKGK